MEGDLLSSSGQVWFCLQPKFNSFELDSEVGRLVSHFGWIPPPSVHGEQNVDVFLTVKTQLKKCTCHSVCLFDHVKTELLPILSKLSHCWIPAVLYTLQYITVHSGCTLVHMVPWSGLNLKRDPFNGHLQQKSTLFLFCHFFYILHSTGDQKD